MANGFASVPAERRFALVNATMPATLLDGAPDAPDPDGLVAADIVVADGKVERIAAAGSQSAVPRFDMRRGMVWPGFVDMHTHIDKAHIWPRKPNPDGTFPAALDAVADDRTRRWSAEDVRRRMDFSLRSAHAHGTTLLRTHIDSLPPQHRISWPVVAAMREKWAGRIDLQAVSLFPIDLFLDPGFAGEIVETVARHMGVLGAVTFMVPELDRALDLMMRAAAERGLDLDFHVDESADPAARSLRAIAEAAIRNRFPGRIVAGHCCSLARQEDSDAGATMDRVAEAGIAIVSLPLCNMYLQDRQGGRTPRWRGITLLHELRARGVSVAVASDNTRDPFYAYGDLDAVEVFREAVRIAHFDHPFGDWPQTVTRTPADVMRRPDRGRIATGLPADLVLFPARTWTELLSRPQADRTVLRSGRPIDTALPDFRELDDIMGTG
ncbi:MAG TPA: cytosine deaminase [Bauldia sp.]|nr:cytosine deaminase [Bauldia sp.]